MSNCACGGVLGHLSACSVLASPLIIADGTARTDTSPLHAAVVGVLDSRDRTIAALEARLVELETQAVADRLALDALRDALRHALADADPKAMSTWEQQDRRTKARWLLEER